MSGFLNQKPFNPNLFMDQTTKEIDHTLSDLIGSIHSMNSGFLPDLQKRVSEMEYELQEKRDLAFERKNELDFVKNIVREKDDQLEKLRGELLSISSEWDALCAAADSKKNPTITQKRVKLLERANDICGILKSSARS